MANLSFNKLWKIVKLIAFFNFALLILDLILVYIASRQFARLYQEVGLEAIYDIGVFNIRVQSAIVILSSAGALYKFWEAKKKILSLWDKFILTLSSLLLLYGAFTVLRIFLETIGRL